MTVYLNTVGRCFYRIPFGRTEWQGNENWNRKKHKKQSNFLHSHDDEMSFFRFLFSFLLLTHLTLVKPKKKLLDIQQMQSKCVLYLYSKVVPEFVCWKVVLCMVCWLLIMMSVSKPDLTLLWSMLHVLYDGSGECCLCVSM